MERHEDDGGNSKTQRKRTKDHVIDELQNTHTDKGANHNQVETACLEQEKFQIRKSKENVKRK